jgi:hypothetical protein
MVATRVKPRGPFYACKHARTHSRVFADISGWNSGQDDGCYLAWGLVIRCRSEPVVRITQGRLPFVYFISFTRDRCVIWIIIGSGTKQLNRYKRVFMIHHSIQGRILLVLGAYVWVGGAKSIGAYFIYLYWSDREKSEYYQVPIQ